MRDLAIGAGDALAIVDIQLDFLPGGALAVPGGDEVIDVINRLSPRFPHVLLTQDWHPLGHVSFASSHAGKRPYDVVQLEYGEQELWPDHCVPGTPGAELHPALDTRAAHALVRKGYRLDIDSYSAFFENDRRTPTGACGLLRELGVRRLFLAGLAADFCVHWTALDARRMGFDVVVVPEATRAIDAHGSADRAWRAMAEAGVRRVDAASLAG